MNNLFTQTKPLVHVKVVAPSEMWNLERRNSIPQVSGIFRRYFIFFPDCGGKTGRGEQSRRGMSSRMGDADAEEAKEPRIAKRIWGPTGVL